MGDKNKIYIGTSGWVYKDWEKIFYPKDLHSDDHLKFFAQEFKTVEINYSFYHLPSAESFAKWKDSVPEDFIFSVKISRFITHIKRMKNIEEPWEKFYENASKLDSKLGPLLLQLPPTFKQNQENLERLENFFNLTGMKNKIACEFRDPGWRNDQTYDLLKKYDCAWVMADSPEKRKRETVTTKMVYIRMHGAHRRSTNLYTTTNMKNLAEKIKSFLENELAVYVYFNNDTRGHAIKNARQLVSLLEKK